jgi:hypothetical protein
VRHGEFRTPHALAFDGRGRLWVADRGNHRIEIFDQNGTYLESRYMFGRPSGLFIRGDTVYVIDFSSRRIVASVGDTRNGSTCDPRYGWEPTSSAGRCRKSRPPDDSMAIPPLVPLQGDRWCLLLIALLHLDHFCDSHDLIIQPPRRAYQFQ